MWRAGSFLRTRGELTARHSCFWLWLKSINLRCDLRSCWRASVASFGELNSLYAGRVSRFVLRRFRLPPSAGRARYPDSRGAVEVFTTPSTGTIRVRSVMQIHCIFVKSLPDVLRNTIRLGGAYFSKVWKSWPQLWQCRSRVVTHPASCWLPCLTLVSSDLQWGQRKLSLLLGLLLLQFTSLKREHNKPYLRGHDRAVSDA